MKLLDPIAGPKRRAVLAGCGGVAHAHVLAARAHPERIELVAAMDTDERRAKSFCEEYQIAAAYTSFDRMLEETRPDLVQIATPPRFHVPLSIKAMEAGAWVWCEKPLCGSLAELDLLQAAEKRTARHTACVFQNRSGSGSKHVKRLIEEGKLGSAHVAVCHTLWYRDRDYFAAPWQGKWATAMGGTTTGHGIHAIDNLLYLLGPWKTVKAEAATLGRSIEVDDVSMALVTFENGMLASIVNSALSPRQETYLRLDFENATVECRYLYDCSNKNWLFSPAPHIDPEPLRDFGGSKANSHSSQLGELLDDMDNNRTPITAGSEARRTIEFIHSLYKSALTGCTVERGSIGPGDPFYGSFNGGRSLRRRRNPFNLNPLPVR